MERKLTMPCPECEAQMSVRQKKDQTRFSAHCPGCGLMMFGPVALLSRLEAHTPVCTHKPELRACKHGFTAWCPVCRIRIFTYKPPINEPSAN